MSISSDSVLFKLSKKNENHGFQDFSYLKFNMQIYESLKKTPMVMMN